MQQDVFQNLRRPEGLSAKFCAEFLVDFSASALLPTPFGGQPERHNQQLGRRFIFHL